ncbi:hypothetical protein CHARACLAT_022806 [Characodon lateralis]|uniref:Uncharacterized protein n=1 Tax=Characodon lateralis TaxID=208331 RepID=A0ABU7E2R0_9TELE|nr:hypothetical protein [Characodon lateralis]
MAVNGKWPALVERFIKFEDTKVLHTTISNTHIHTPTVVGYIMATAALRQTVRSKAATTSVPLSPLTAISRQGGSCQRTQRLRHMTTDIVTTVAPMYWVQL